MAPTLEETAAQALFSLTVVLNRNTLVPSTRKGALDRKLRTATATRSLIRLCAREGSEARACLVFPCTSYNPSVYLAMHCVGIRQVMRRRACRASFLRSPACSTLRALRAMLCYFLFCCHTICCVARVYGGRLVALWFGR